MTETIAEILQAHRTGAATPADTVARSYARIRAHADPAVIITLRDEAAAIAEAKALMTAGPEGRPLYGIPVAIKDNIDAEGMPTTAACPAFAYKPARDATVVARLRQAGAIVIGKTNLDQFATGLVGVRSPYGIPRNALNPALVPGGSSSGSAVAVAAGLVSFSLGTDTAGSGRVPAAFNNIVGLKPTRGLLSARGVVPACRSLDCVSIFGLTAADAAAVLRVAQGFDPADPFSRRSAPPARALPRSFAGLRFGVPREDQLQFFGNPETPRLFEEMLDKLSKMGAQAFPVDFSPFLETARLLYEGPWVAERYVAIREFIERKPKALHPVTAAIIGAAKRFSANDAFDGYYRLKELQRRTAPVWDEIDILVTPTAGTIYRVDELEAEPVKLNSNLGYYTNFMNLLDLAAIAVPAGFQRDGLPFGVTLAAPAFNDEVLCALGDIAHRAAVKTMGATGLPTPALTDLAPSGGQVIQVAVCGAHMSGLPLNKDLLALGATLVGACRTSASYRFYRLPGTGVARPGLVRVAGNGASVDGEIWRLPTEAVGAFLASIPQPLGLGDVMLDDGRRLKGFLCEAVATKGATDITEHGGWRRYLASL